MPEKVLKKLNLFVQPQWKVCFFSAIVAGLLAHLYKITGWLPNWDSLVFRYDSQNMLALGRWFLPVVCSFTSFFDLPLLNGVIAILFHALGAVCICHIFHVKKKITAGLIGALMVSVPTVISVMMYNYVADGYSIAFFLATLAALYLTKEKPNYLLATVLIGLSSGIYQAYLTVTIVLVLFHLIDKIVFQKASFGLLWKQTLWMLLSGVLGVALYGIVLKLLLAVCSVELLDYQGMNETASLSNLNLPASLYVAKETFLHTFFDVSGGWNVYVVLNLFILVATLFWYLKAIVQHQLYRKPGMLFLVLVLSVALILGAGALAFINPGVDYHNLMRMGYAMFYLPFLLLYEKEPDASNRSAIQCWVVLLTALSLIGNQIVIANVSYHKAQMAYEKSYGVLVRLADRIEQTPKSETCTKILAIGALEHSEAYSVNLTPDITGITDGYILRADDEIVNQSVLCSALNDYCGKNYQFVSGEEKQKLLQREEVQAMNLWPSDGCVIALEDTVIVKLGTEGEAN